MIKATAVRYDAPVCLSARCFYVNFFQLQTTQTGSKIKRAQCTTTPAEHHSPYQGIYMHA